MKQIVLKNEIINNPPKLDPSPFNGEGKTRRYSIVQREWGRARYKTTVKSTVARENTEWFENYKKEVEGQHLFETVGFDVSVRSDNGYLDFVYEADSKEEADEALRYITCQIKNGAVEELKEHDRTGHLWYIVNNECPF